MLGALSRRLGDFDLAEEALAEAVTEALKRWPEDGVPQSPTGWLVTTGWRKALDRLRREVVGRDKVAAAGAEPPPEPGVDDRLAMIFACCHPDLAEPARVALTLYAASGLSTVEIAAAFLVPMPTMAQPSMLPRMAVSSQTSQVTMMKPNSDSPAAHHRPV